LVGLQGASFVESLVKKPGLISGDDGKSSQTKKMTAHGDMGRHNEEDIEVCSISIDLWGNTSYILLHCGMSSFFFIFFIRNEILQLFFRAL
jgi:hypothetical protein